MVCKDVLNCIKVHLKTISRQEDVICATDNADSSDVVANDLAGVVVSAASRRSAGIGASVSGRGRDPRTLRGGSPSAGMSDHGGDKIHLAHTVDSQDKWIAVRLSHAAGQDIQHAA